MGLFDGIIGAETPNLVSNMSDSQSTPIGGTTGSSSGGTSDDGSTPVIVDQTNPPLIITTDADTDSDSIIIHDEPTIVTSTEHDIAPIGFEMSDMVSTPSEATNTTPEIISLIDTAEESPVIQMTTPTSSPTTSQASLEDRIAGFVADLEKLKADDEMLLHEKESAIKELEAKMKDLTKEIKKIQADEKRIDATIASINAPESGEVKSKTKSKNEVLA